MQATEQGGNVTRETFLQFVEEYRDVDAAVHEAVGMRKDLRARIKGAGIRLRAFDRARKDADMSGEVREAEDREYRRLLTWFGKPIGYQEQMFDNEETEDDIPDLQKERVRQAGALAARAGQSRGRNPWSPGTVLEQVWDAGWDDEAQRLTAAAPAPEPAAAGGPSPANNGARRRGRPPGARDSQPRTRRPRQRAESDSP